METFTLEAQSKSAVIDIPGEKARYEEMLKSMEAHILHFMVRQMEIFKPEAGILSRVWPGVVNEVSPWIAATRVHGVLAISLLSGQQGRHVEQSFGSIGAIQLGSSTQLGFGHSHNWVEKNNMFTDILAKKVANLKVV